MEKAIEELAKLKKELNGILDEVIASRNTSLGWEKLRLWKKRAVKLVGSLISKKEAQELEQKGIVIISGEDPFSDFRDEVEVHDVYLRSLIEEIKKNPDFILEGELEEKKVNGDYLSKLKKILKNFPKVARQLHSRHESRTTLEVEDEYDVQDLLHALLKIEFEDIRPEEWTPSYAGGSSRMDFLLKKEKCVVETKKTRKGLDEKEIGEQLLVDIEKYKQHPDCRMLVCFIYDPEGRIGNPKGLITDLENQSKEKIKVQVFIAP